MSNFKDRRVHFRNPGMKGLREMDTFSRETTLSKLFFLPSEKGSTLNGKNLLPLFLFRVDPFQKGFTCRKANRKSQKLSPLLKAEIYQVYLAP